MWLEGAHISLTTSNCYNLNYFSLDLSCLKMPFCVTHLSLLVNCCRWWLTTPIVWNSTIVFGLKFSCNWCGISHVLINPSTDVWALLRAYIAHIQGLLILNHVHCMFAEYLWHYSTVVTTGLVNCLCPGGYKYYKHVVQDAGQYSVSRRCNKLN